MKVSKKRSTAGTIAFSIIVASILLAAGTWFFVYWAIPAYELDSAVIYSLFIRVLPLLIGLTVLQIGVILSIPNSKDEADAKDILLRDSFDDPLYILPDEDPPISSVSPFKPIESVATPPVAATLAQPIHKPEPKVERHMPPVTTYISPPVQPVLAEMPIAEEPIVNIPTTVESISADETVVQTESSIIEIPETGAPAAIASGVESVVPPTARLTQAVNFADYPYSIEADSDIAQLLQPLPETESVNDPLLLKHQLLINDVFEDRLDSEIESALENGYDLSLGIITMPNVPVNPLEVTAGVTQHIFQKLESMSFFYALDEQRIAAVIPFYRFKTARYYFAALLENLRKNHPDNTVAIGFSSLHNRDISRETLLQEAEIATSWAKEQGGFSLIGYESENIEESFSN